MQINITAKSLTLASAIFLALCAGSVLNGAQQGNQTGSSASGTTPTWTVIKNYELVNQTASITTPITIFTPPQDGLFRVSGYVQILSLLAASPDLQISEVNVQNTDSLAVVPLTTLAYEDANLQNGMPVITGQASNVKTIYAKANTPVTITTLNVTVKGSPVAPYNVYVVVEHLQ